jgi:hypothetical protein
MHPVTAHFISKSTNSIRRSEQARRTLNVFLPVLTIPRLQRNIPPEIGRQLALGARGPRGGGAVGLHPAGVLAVADIRVWISATHHLRGQHTLTTAFSPSLPRHDHADIDNVSFWYRSG